MMELLPYWAVLGWLVASFMAGQVGHEKGDGFRSAFFLGLFFSPLLALLYAAALPDRGASATGAGPLQPKAGKPKTPGPSLDEWRDAMEQGRLCGACGAILDVALKPGERCPKCEVRRK